MRVSCNDLKRQINKYSSELEEKLSNVFYSGSYILG